MKLTILFTAIYVSIGMCFAQQNTFRLASVLSEMGVDLTINKLPSNYIFRDDTVKVFSVNKIDNNEMGGWMLQGSISSIDNNFLSTIYAYPLSLILDSLNNTREAIGHNLGVKEDGGYLKTGFPNYQHNSYIMQFLSRNGRTYNVNKKLSTHYYTLKESRLLFNADTVVQIPLNISVLYNAESYDHYGYHYNHMQAYVIHRHNHGFFTLFCFTNDDGQRDFDRHFKAMQQIFRYKDDEETN